MTTTHKAIVQIINEKGMHARTAAQFVQQVQKSPSDTITVIKDGTEVDGRSVLGLLTLSASQGTSMTICAKGKTAKETLTKLVQLVESGFTEDIIEKTGN